MTRIRGSVDISRPVGQVFDTVADQRNEVQYNAQMTRSVKVGDGPIGVGTVFEATVVSRGRPLDMTIRYTAFDRPRLLASRSEMAGVVVRGTLRCDPTEEGTRLSWDWQLLLPWPARCVGFLVAEVGRRQERRIWSGLKDHLEARP